MESDLNFDQQLNFLNFQKVRKTLITTEKSRLVLVAWLTKTISLYI